MAISRCKSCGAGFHGESTVLQRVSRWRPWRNDRQLCEACFPRISRQSGSDAPVSLLYGQLRIPGSLANRTPSSEFGIVIRRLYRTAESALDEHGGVVMTLSGTTVLALWSPLIGDSNHARRALEAGHRLVEQLDSDRILRRRARAGVAVHTGSATVELTGTPRSHRFAISGDALETVEHLAAGAPDNQLHPSPATLAAAGPD